METYTLLRDAAAAVPYFWFFCDFMRADDVVSGGSFSGTAISAGTIAVLEGNGGKCRLSGVATTDATGYQIQGLASHVCTDNKVLNYKCAAQLGETTSTDVPVESQIEWGFFVTDTSIDASLPTDGIYFSKADGGTAIQCIVRVGSSNTFTKTITPVMDKNSHTYGIYVQSNGTNSSVFFFMDGILVAQATGLTLPTTVLAPSFAFRAGNALGTKFIDVDYIGSLQAR